MAATAFVAVGGTAGVASAAQGALPGDALYPVKRVIEGAQFTLSTSDTGRGHDLLGQASHRLEEIEALLPDAQGSEVVTDRVQDTVGAFRQQAEDGSRLLLDAFGEDGDPQHAVDVRTFAADSMDALTSMAATAPDGLLDDLREAARTVRDVDVAALAACGSCGDADAVEVPQDFGTRGPEALGDLADRAHGARAGTTSTDLFGFFSGGTSQEDAGSLLVPGAPGSAGDPGASAGGPTDLGTPTGVPSPSDGATDGGPVPPPSDAPTGAPTGGPSDVPSDGPTAPDTGQPSGDPSTGPSEGPTDGPTGGQTGEPEEPDGSPGTTAEPTDDGEPDGGDRTAGADPQEPDPGSSDGPTDPGGQSGDASGGPATLVGGYADRFRPLLL